MPQRGDYALTTKLASLGLSFLSRSGVVDIAQPIIERLAAATEELVRLAIVEDERLTLVAKAQGARSGLLYDPDMGIQLQLSCSAAGHAWLMTYDRKSADRHQRSSKLLPSADRIVIERYHGVFWPERARSSRPSTAR